MIDPLLPSAQLADDPILEPSALPSMCTGAWGPERGPTKRERQNYRERESISRIKKNFDGNWFAYPFDGSCDYSSYEMQTGGKSQSKSGFRGPGCTATHRPLPLEVTQKGSPLNRSMHAFMSALRWSKRVETPERWESETWALREGERMHRCLLHLCTTSGPKKLPWQSMSTPCIQWLK